MAARVKSRTLIAGLAAVAAGIAGLWGRQPRAPACDFRRVDARRLADIVRGNGVPMNSEPFLKEPWLVSHAFELPRGAANRTAFVRSFGGYPVEVIADMERMSATGSAPRRHVPLSDWASSVGRLGSANYSFMWLWGRHHRLGEALRESYGLPFALKRFGLIGTRFLVVGSRTKGIALHAHDVTQVALLEGQKRWFVFPPSKAPPIARAKHHSAEALRAAPQSRTCLQRAGEVVVLPSGWWHATVDEADWVVGLGAQPFPSLGPMDRQLTLGSHFTDPLRTDVGIELAAAAGNLSVLEAQTPAGKSTPALLIAAASGHRPAVQWLLSRRGDPAASEVLGRQAIHAAAGHGHVEVLQLLLDRGLGASTSDGQGRHPMHWAASAGHVDVVEALAGRRADINAPIKSSVWPGFTPLQVATEWHQVSVVEALVRLRADVRAKDFDGKTPLHAAAEVGDEMIARILLRNGAELSAQTKHGLRPLDIATRRQNRELMEILS